MSILLILATVIEGFTSHTLSEVLSSAARHEPLQARLIDDTKSRIGSASWRALTSIFHTVMGEQMEELLDEELRVGIGHLFNLRNGLVHGVPIEIRREDLQSTKWAYTRRQYEKVHEYLTGLGLAPSLEPYSEMINNDSADHFHRLTGEFLKCLCRYDPLRIWAPYKQLVENYFGV
jgi:hypothetical protein